MGIAPQGEEVRKAVKWISDQKRYEGETDITQLVQKAGLKFNLSPREEGDLERFVRQSESF